MNRWGIVLGRTQIECAVLDRDMKMVINKRATAETHKGYNHILWQILILIDSVSEIMNERPLHIGVATSGVLEPSTQRMRNCNILCMNGRLIKDDLEHLLQTQVKITNDANSFVLAEAHMGAGKKHPDAKAVFGVILGTGVGAGLAVNKEIIEGKPGLGGQWEHNILEENGHQCYCGKKGCIEQVLSDGALERYYEELSGTHIKLPEIYLRHKTGSDADATRTIERLLEYYGRAISILVNVFDPGLIVIGGGVGNIDLLYTQGYERIKKYVCSDGGLTTPICKPLFGDTASVFGAALLC